MDSNISTLCILTLVFTLIEKELMKYKDDIFELFVYVDLVIISPWYYQELVFRPSCSHHFNGACHLFLA